VPTLQELEVGPYRLSVDIDRTREAYATIQTGGPEECGCDPCKNIVANRATIYPPALITLLAKLGVDPKKEAEVYHTCRLRPGVHSYGGWFHVIGEVVQDADELVALAPGVRVWFKNGAAVAQDAFKTQPVMRVEMELEIPWKIDLPEPE
jgi:hypothetical protein